VDSVVLAGEPGFLPADANWLQMRVSVMNVGARPVKVTAVNGRLPDGSVVPSAQTPTQLQKPPSITGNMATTLGFGTAGILAGAFIFPPAALVGGLYGAARPMLKADRFRKRLSQINDSGLKAQSIAPTTSAAGNVWIPAVREQNALVILYEVDGQAQSLIVPRAS
jgi:hypothetical protein